MTEEQENAVVAAWGPMIKACSDEMLSALDRIEQAMKPVGLPLDESELRPLIMGAFHGVTESFSRTVLARADSHPSVGWYNYGLERMRAICDSMDNDVRDRLVNEINAAIAPPTPVPVAVVESI